MGDFVDPVAAVHEAIRRCQIKRDNMGRKCSMHGHILLIILREGTTLEIECLPVFPELKVRSVFITMVKKVKLPLTTWYLLHFLKYCHILMKDCLRCVGKYTTM